MFPYMTETLTKAIMKRSELESKYVKNKNVTDAKKFWKTGKVIFV